MRARLTKLGAALAALAALAIGGAALASGAGGDSQPATSAGTAEERGEGEDGEESPSYQSSITASEQEGTSEEAEAKALQAKATVTADEARDVALEAVSGNVVAVELDNENGSVVYSVEIAKADGTTVDVKVDAGNAKVLAQETGEDEQSEQDEAGE